MKRFWLANTIPLQRVATLKLPFIRNGYNFPVYSLQCMYKSFLVFLLLFANVVNAQQTDADKLAAYQKKVEERVAKIVNTLDITDPGIYKTVSTVIVTQYFLVNDIHEENKKAVDAIKEGPLTKEEMEADIKVQEEKKSARLLQQHGLFIALLKDRINDEQLEKVKDGMTYRVFPITYAAYQDMLPTLTQEQKDKIYNWLKEARELAMDAESSDKKHAVFGKYKGKVNNYLSAAGYDMKKEGEEWRKRIKERESKAKPVQGS